MRTHMAVLCIGLGMGIYRCTHEWPVWFGETHHPIGADFIGSANFFLAVDVGKLTGVVLYIALCYLFDKRRESGILLIMPSAVLVAGYTLPLLSGLGVTVNTVTLTMGLVACGVGAGMLFAQWIEVCGHLPPLKTIETFAVSYLVRFLLLPVITGCELPVSSVLITTLAGTSFVQIAYCYRIITVVPGAPVRVRQLPARRAGTGYGLLFIWVCVFTFAFGLGEGRTNLAHSVTVSGVGYALPSLLVSVLAFKLADRFDRKLLYAVSIPLMAAGLVSIEFFGASAVFAQLLVSAGMCAFELLVYTTACIYAFNTGTSSMFAGGCVRVLALLAADIAVVLVRFASGINSSLLVAVATIATVALGLVMFLPQVSERIEQRRLSPGETNGDRTEHQKRLSVFARDIGLSPREATVFALLAKGRTAAQISEELFISNGAVRAHCSRIYSKCGVHTRKEFDDLVVHLG